MYRSLALGPLVTLERVVGLDEARLPARRLALSLPQLSQSMQKLLEQRRGDNALEVVDLRAFAATSDRILAPTQRPARIGSKPLTYLLRGGYELRLLADGGSLRMNLARSGQAPFAQWTLGYGASLRSFAATRATGRAVAVEAVASELVAREERHELVKAVAVISAMQKDR